MAVVAGTIIDHDRNSLVAPVPRRAVEVNPWPVREKLPTGGSLDSNNPHTVIEPSSITYPVSAVTDNDRWLSGAMTAPSGIQSR